MDTVGFFSAVAAGDVEDVRARLDRHPELLAETSEQGVSPALTALYGGHAPLADELAARTGELNVFEAAAFDDTQRLSGLIEGDPAVVESWSSDGWQPLHLACYFGRVEAARLLLDADAPVAEPARNQLAVQPLHAAAAGQHAELVWLLIASDAPVGATQAQGWTALHSAVRNGDVESVRALLAAGASLDVAADDATTARQLLALDAPAVLRDLVDGTGA